nr:GDSL-type esterase/lipase family protein [uncultured Deefgea sp.]
MRFLSLLFLIALLSACGQAKLEPLPANAVILAYGDSLTFGTGAAAGEDYPAQLSRLIAHPVINAGVPGEMTAQGLQRLNETLDEVKPKLVLLGLGGNDFLQRLPAEEVKANLAAMLSELKQRQISVVLLAVPSMSIPPKPHPLFAELAAQADVVLAEDEWFDILRKASLKSDAVHPNAAGYAQFAAAMAELLKEHGAIRD